MRRYCTVFRFILIGDTPYPIPHILCFTPLLDLMSLRQVVKESFDFHSSCLVNVTHASGRGINLWAKHKMSSFLGSKVVKWKSVFCILLWSGRKISGLSTTNYLADHRWEALAPVQLPQNQLSVCCSVYWPLHYSVKRNWVKQGVPIYSVQRFYARGC